MNYKKIPLLALFFLGLCISLFAQNEDVEWTEVSKSKELEVYKRAPENSVWKEIKIIHYIKAPMDIILDIVGDVDSYTEWIFKCSGSRIIEKISDNEMIYYSLTDMPFPFWDRELIVHSTGGFDEATQTYLFQSHAVEGYEEARSNIVRITNFTSSWEIRELEDGIIEVISITSVDPAGAIPAWVVNLGVTKGPTKTAQRFRERVAERIKFAEGN